MTTNQARLAAAVASNKRGTRICDTTAALLFLEYCRGGSSYRKLAAKYKISTGAVTRAIKRASGFEGAELETKP